MDTQENAIDAQRRFITTVDTLRDEILSCVKEISRLNAAFRILDQIIVGGAATTGTEPEEIQQVVEKFVLLKSQRDDLLNAASEVAERLRINAHGKATVTQDKAARLRSILTAAISTVNPNDPVVL